MNPGAPAIAALSGEPGIASVPAPRASPTDCSPVAVSRPVTGLSRASCRDASGLAVLMSTGRRAGLPGLSRPAAPAPPVARPGSCASPARAARSASSPTASCSGGLPGIANPGGLGQPGHQSRPREWKAARQMGTGLPGRMPGLVPGPRPTRRIWASAMFLWRGREGSLGVGSTPGLPEAARVRLPPGDLDSVSGRARLYYRHAAELFETATRGMRGGRRTVRR